VTVLVGGLLVHGRVRFASEHTHGVLGVYGTVRHGVAGIVPLQDIALADEGSVWCRGHVNAKDKAGAALLVAGALAPKQSDKASWHEITDSQGNKKYLPIF
jgi:hypothetical protein